MVFFQRLFSLAFIASNLSGSIRIRADQRPRSFVEKSTGSGRLNFPLAPSSSPTSEQQASSLSASRWSSYMTVDPSTITILSRFFLDDKLKRFASLLHCDQAKLNLGGKELLIQNFTVSLPNDIIESLKIGRIHVTWDSYSRPCLEVQVENVEILMESTNLVFSRNNWDELNDLGFPPKMAYYPASNATDPAAASYEFIRIGSLDLKGQVVLHTRSRPLQKPLSEDIVFRLDVIRELNQRIRILADQNAIQMKRRGCTSDEIYEIFQSFFSSKAKEAIKLAIEDLAVGKMYPTRDSRLVGESRKILATAKAALSGYADGVESFSKEKVKERLRVAGEDGDSIVSDEEIDRIVTGGLETLKGSIKSLGTKALYQLDSMRQPKNSTKVLQDDEIMFPDW